MLICGCFPTKPGEKFCRHWTKTDKVPDTIDIDIFLNLVPKCPITFTRYNGEFDGPEWQRFLPSDN
jgi:hypothetical protein